MGILVLIVFLALIPIIICLTELREQHFIFQMISQSIKEKQTGAGDVLGISILDTVNNFNCSQCVDWVEYL